MSDPFLARWSRMKRRSETTTRPPPQAPPTEQSPPPVAGATDTREPPAQAALPKLDDITADTDITCFLRSEVPAAARNAALRKVWLLDPAIRDFVGPARDYSYDWNVPGGVPGSGPIECSEAASKLVDVLLGPPPAPATAPTTTPAASCDMDDPENPCPTGTPDPAAVPTEEA